MLWAGRASPPRSGLAPENTPPKAVSVPPPHRFVRGGITVTDSRGVDASRHLNFPFPRRPRTSVKPVASASFIERVMCFVAPPSTTIMSVPLRRACLASIRAFSSSAASDFGRCPSTSLPENPWAARKDSRSSSLPSRPAMSTRFRSARPDVAAASCAAACTVDA